MTAILCIILQVSIILGPIFLLTSFLGNTRSLNALFVSISICMTLVAMDLMLVVPNVYGAGLGAGIILGIMLLVIPATIAIIFIIYMIAATIIGGSSEKLIKKTRYILAIIGSMLLLLVGYFWLNNLELS